MKNRHGFTIVEVSFFLAITGLLFLAVTVGVQNSIYRQRYNDSVQSYVEFLRGVYSQASNVQNLNNGRSDEAIYGKLVTFGESKNPKGETNENGIFTYDVVGDVEGVGSLGGSDILDLLKQRHLKVLEVNGSKLEPVGMVESFIPKWSSTIQKPNMNLFKGALLIVRHPRSGNVYTFVRDNETVEVNNTKQGGAAGMSDTWFSSQLSDFSIKEVDFCVTPDGVNTRRGRADVRIKARASGSSGIEVFYDDDNRCD